MTPDPDHAQDSAALAPKDSQIETCLDWVVRVFTSPAADIEGGAGGIEKRVHLKIEGDGPIDMCEAPNARLGIRSLSRMASQCATRFGLRFAAFWREATSGASTGHCSSLI